MHILIHKYIIHLIHAPFSVIFKNQTVRIEQCMYTLKTPTRETVPIIKNVGLKFILKLNIIFLRGIYIFKNILFM